MVYETACGNEEGSVVGMLKALKERGRKEERGKNEREGGGEQSKERVKNKREGGRK